MVATGQLSDDLPVSALRRWLVIAAWFAVLVASRVHTSAHAAEARAYMLVTATVVDSVSIRSVHQAQRLLVTPQDIERGYVDVFAGSRFEIKHKGSCLFEFRAVSNIFRSVKVSGLEGSTELGAEGGTMLQKSSGSAPARVAVNYRFQLAPGVSAGAYPWPLSLTILPM